MFKSMKDFETETAERETSGGPSEGGPVQLPQAPQPSRGH